MTERRKPRYVFFLQWPLTYDGGVNNVVSGLCQACLPHYEPAVSLTSPTRPHGYAGIWTPLPYLNAARPLGYILRMLPAMIRMHRFLKGAVAANPHYAGWNVCR